MVSSKKRGGICLLIVLFLVVLSLQAAAYTGLPNLEILKDSLTPEPVEPGQDLVLKIKVYNRDRDLDAIEISLSADIQYPFYFKAQNPLLEKPFDLCIGCTRDVTYYLTLDSKAKSGTYPIWIRLSSGSSVVKRLFAIKVIGKPDLVMTSTSHDQLTPNQLFTPNLTITNVGTGLARIVQVQVNPAGFVVLGGDTKAVRDLEAGASTTISFDLVVGENTNADVYKIPVELLCQDELGNKYSKTANMGVRVVNSAQLNIESVKVTSLRDRDPLIAVGEPFSVDLRVENVGHGDADFTTVWLENCPFEGTQRAFIGNLKKDEDALAVFTMVARKKGRYSCTVHMQFQDDLGLYRYRDRIDIYVSQGDTRMGFVVFLLVLLGFLGYLYKDKLLRKRR